MLPLGNAVLLGEGREETERGVEHRGAELLALEILRRLDAALLQGVDAERREVVGHEHAEHFLARVLGVVLDGRVHVGEPDLVGARRDTLDRTGRALAGVHGDVEAFGLVVALFQRDQERRGRPWNTQSRVNLMAVCALAGRPANTSATAVAPASGFASSLAILLMWFPLDSCPATLRRTFHGRQGISGRFYASRCHSLADAQHPSDQAEDMQFRPDVCRGKARARLHGAPTSVRAPAASAARRPCRRIPCGRGTRSRPRRLRHEQVARVRHGHRGASARADP